MQIRTRWVFNVVMVVLVLGVWAGFNYGNYSKSVVDQKDTVTQNLEMIDRTKDLLELKKRVAVSNERVSVKMDAIDTLGPPPPPKAMQVGDIDVQLAELELQRSALLQQVSNKTSLTNKMSVDNPLINTLLIPVLLLFFTKGIDLGYKIMCKKFGVTT